jgi:nucleoside-diphosphate-sugar epimerase
MRILVTGYLGYLGSVLVPMLLDEGHTVFGIDSELFKRCVFYKPPFDIPNVKRDIRDVELDDLYGFDAVIHLAGLSNDPLGDLSHRATYDINYSAAVRLASLAKFADVPRFLFSSTCAVYGTTARRFVNEDSQLQPLTVFATAKMRAERDISLLADSYFTPVFLRKPTMYGMSPYHRTDSALNNMVAWATAKGQVLLKSDGNSWRPYIHVEDVARAFLAALNAPAKWVHNHALNVCTTNDNYQTVTVAQMVQSYIPNTRIEYADHAQPDARSYRVDGSKIAATLPEWQPSWTLEDGIRQLHAAYEDKGLGLEDFEGARYKRVSYMKHLITSKRVDETFRWAEKQVRAAVAEYETQA